MRSPPPFDQRRHVLIRATCHRMAAVLHQAAAGCSVIANCFEGVEIVVSSVHTAWLRAIPAHRRPATVGSFTVSAHEEAAPAGSAPHPRYCTQPAFVLAQLTYVRGDTATDAIKRADRSRCGDLLRWHSNASVSDDEAKTSGGRYLGCGAGTNEWHIA